MGNDLEFFPPDLYSFNIYETHILTAGADNGFSVWLLQSVEVSWRDTIYTHMVLQERDFTIA
jgi:hypothetical protein